VKQTRALTIFEIATGIVIKELEWPSSRSHFNRVRSRLCACGRAGTPRTEPKQLMLSVAVDGCVPCEVPASAIGNNGIPPPPSA
jgi:hypothetical protein